MVPFRQMIKTLKWQQQENRVEIQVSFPINRRFFTQQDEENYIIVGVTSDIQHHVNITLRTCTCPVGMATGSCEHLNAVRKRRLQEVFYEITNSESFPFWCVA